MKKRDLQNIKITSPQNVELDYIAASLGDRMMAYLIDFVILFIFSILLQVIYPSDFFDQILGYDLNYILRVLLIAIPFLFYDVVFEYLLNGQTPGKKMMKVRVVRLDGEKPELSHFAIRWAFRIVESGTMALGLIPVLSYTITKKHQRLGDLAAGTAVIKIDDSLFFSSSILFNKVNDYHPLFTDTSWATRQDIEVIYHCLHKIFTKNSARELHYLSQFADKIIEKYQIDRTSDTELAKMTTTQLARTFAKDFNFHQITENTEPRDKAIKIRRELAKTITRPVRETT